MGTDEDNFSEPSSHTGAIEDEGELSDRDSVKEEDLDQKICENENYRETMRR